MRVVITTTHSCNNIMQSVTLILFIRSWKMYIKKNLFTVPISVYNFLISSILKRQKYKPEKEMKFRRKN